MVCKNQENESKCCVHRLINYNAIKIQILILFKDDSMYFVRIGVGRDLSKIGRDYYFLPAMKNIKMLQK